MTTVSSIRTRFSIRFIRALKRISTKGNELSSNTIMITRRKQQMIKRAAYVSMASAVGPRRAWVRALKWKLKPSRTRFISRPAWLMSRRRRRRMMKRIGSVGGGEREKKVACRSEEEEVLRRLVPGGEGMDIYKLLGETAHYIKCLSTQVEVMTTITDHLYNI
ncbi:transcription factor IBH1-like [Impatiens glandulifera]|uniref:transcription factor IBH1-like n=1 Tax=Impatiens glandulifera TaxID=253017 RepID=UPI001FB05EAA|nr:transcription factor IBH1-like [Impatiens glandulifera]